MTTYMLHGVIVTTLGLVALAWPARQRGVALASGLAAAPTGLLDALFMQDYWQPPHFVAPWASVEGVLFSFGNGILLWLVASRPLRAALPRAKPLAAFAAPLLGLGAFTLAVSLTLWSGGLALTGLALMPAMLLALALTGALILARTPRLAPLALAGAAGFTLVYAGELAVLGALDPSYPGLWNAATRTGGTFLGFPAWELGWAAVYGAVWPLCIGWALTRRAAASPASMDAPATPGQHRWPRSAPEAPRSRHPGPTPRD